MIFQVDSGTSMPLISPSEPAAPAMMYTSRRGRFEERCGYHDGLMRDRGEAFEHRRFNPFGSLHFRFGGGDYREGIRSGCDYGHRRSADDYGHRYGRGY
jgi:hypothetical protein